MLHYNEAKNTDCQYVLRSVSSQCSLTSIFCKCTQSKMWQPLKAVIINS